MTAAKRLTKDQLFRLNQQGPELVDAVNILGERKRRHRDQFGEVVQHADKTWWLRYFVDNAFGNRVKIAERLNVPANANARVRDDERARRMKEVNAGAIAQTVRADDATLGSFFQYTYLPWLKKEKPYSTWHSVERRWNTYMQPIANKMLRSFRTIDGTEFLTHLANKPLRNVRGKLTGVIGLNQATHRSCRNLLSAVFRHAINTRGTGWEDRVNPIRECKQLTAPRKAVEREPYTDEEVVAIIDGIKRTEGKLMFALCACMGLRPSEAAALKWSDFGASHLSISRSAPYGHLREDTKTEASKNDVKISDEVARLLVKLKAERPNDEPDEFLFQKPGGLPVDHNTFAWRHITRDAKRVCPRYSGLYNARHSAGSELKRVTGKSLAPAQALRHSISTSEKTYQHVVTSDGDAGIVLRDANLAAIRAKRQAWIQ